MYKKYAMVLLSAMIIIFGVVKADAVTLKNNINTDEYGIEETLAPENGTSLSGKCGKNLTWELKWDNNYNSEVLTIKGTGDMGAWNPAPWDSDLWDDEIAFPDQMPPMVVVIEEGVTSISEGAFAECPITKIEMPSSLKMIGARAFSECYYLQSVNIRSEVVGEAAFEYCENLSEVTISSSVRKIKAEAFYNCGVKKLTIEEGLEEIGDEAFWGDGYGDEVVIEEIKLPETLKILGCGVFFKVGNITFPSSLQDPKNDEYAGAVYSAENVIFAEGTTTIYPYMCAISAIKNVYLPDSVKKIDTDRSSGRIGKHW